MVCVMHHWILSIRNLYFTGFSYITQVTLWLLCKLQHFTVQDLQSHKYIHVISHWNISNPFHILKQKLLTRYSICTTNGMHQLHEHVCAYSPFSLFRLWEPFYNTWPVGWLVYIYNMFCFLGSYSPSPP